MKLLWCDVLSHIFPQLYTVCYRPSQHLHVTTPPPSPVLPPPPSAQASDVIFGTALVATLPCHTQRKVPLLLAWYGPVSCSQVPLAQNRWRLRLLQRVTQWLLLPVKTKEVRQGVRGGDAERRGVACELCAGLPGVPIVLHCNITERTPLEGIWRRTKTHSEPQEQTGAQYEAWLCIIFTFVNEKVLFFGGLTTKCQSLTQIFWSTMSSYQPTWAHHGAETWGC